MAHSSSSRWPAVTCWNSLTREPTSAKRGAASFKAMRVWVLASLRSKKVYTSQGHRSLLVSECYCRIHARGAACGEIGC